MIPMPLKTRRKLKDLVGEALLRTGFWERSLRTWARRGQAVVLTYHRVIEKWGRTLDYSQPGMVITAETFDRQLAFLKEHFHIVPLRSLLFDRETGRLDDKPRCVITFDDGWRDNYEIAFPILRKHGVPATVFLTVDFIGASRTFWHTDLLYLLLQGQLSRLSGLEPAFQRYPGRVRRHLIRLTRLTSPPSASDADALIEAVKEACDEETISSLIQDIECAIGFREGALSERRFFLDWTQVREMAAGGIEIGSHGCSHRILTRLRPKEAVEELTRSKREIEMRTGQVVWHFAVPYGAAGKSLLALVARAGYHTACVCKAGLGRGLVSPVVVPRVTVHEAVSGGTKETFSESGTALWLFRGPKMERTWASW